VPGDAWHFYFSFCEAEQREDSFSSSQVLLSTQPDFIRAIIFYNSSYSNNEFVPNIIQDQHAVFIFSFPTSLLPNLKMYRNEEIQRDSSLEQHFASTRFWYIPNMPIHTRTNKEGIYFITFTCYGWLPLFEVSNGFDAVYHFFKALTMQGHTVLAYVIMPNHVHFLLHYNGGKSLNTVMGNGKRFMAYEIIKLLEQKKKHILYYKS